MKAETFLEQIEHSAPSVEEMKNYGLEEADIPEILATFQAYGIANVSDEFSNELLRLIGKYDCSTLEVGLIRFIKEPLPHSMGIVFGYCEADPLVIRQDGSIAMYDHAQEDYCMLKCATSSEQFLSAMAKMNSIRMQKEEWIGKFTEGVSACAEAAGGEKYQKFYAMLCPKFD